MKIRMWIVLMLSCLVTSIHAQQPTPFQRGEGVFTYNDYQPFEKRPVDVHYYIPTKGDIQQMPIIFVFEGADRGYSYLLEAWKEEAERLQFILCLPHFDLKVYPLANYQEVGVMNAQHTIVNSKENLTPVLIDKIFEFVKARLSGAQQGYMIYGHSAGGQFVQRFMLFHDSPYVQKAMIGCPGWYTFPDVSQLFPYGVKNIPYVDSEQLKKYLETPVVLQLALGDTIRESYLRKTPEAEWQGRNRLERGRKFYHYIHQLAKEKGWECNWRLIEEEGIGHVSVPMGKRAASVLMQDSLRVLFVGNSYTFYNKLIRQVQSLAASCGEKLSVKQVAHGGWRLRQHVADEKSVKAIQEGDWDYVVMQEQSKEPTYERAFIEANVFPAAASLDSLRRLYAPKGKSVFYMTWGRDNDTFLDMQQKLAETYLEMARRQDALCAPVGIAWKRVRAERPDLKLHTRDTSHPTKLGSYLTACVFYALFSEKTFKSDYYDGLPEADACYLQRIAQEVVFSNPILWNLKKSSQPKKVTERFFQDPSSKYNTPTLSKPIEEGLASIYEIEQYWQALAEKYPNMVRLDFLGETSQGRSLPIVYLGEPSENKLKIWIQAGLHGNEPAGVESACMLGNYLLQTPEGNEWLNHISLAILPIANPDGYALQRRTSGDGYDLNRDQTKLADPITSLLKQAYNQWQPEIALDIHEYTPIRKEYQQWYGKKAGTFADVMFLPSGHLNVSPGIRALSNGIFRQKAELALKECGYQSGFYFTPKMIGDTLYVVKDAKSPQSSSTFQALTNAVSVFIEIRGIGLGQDSFKRRSECGFLVARSLVETAVEQKHLVKKEIGRAVQETIKRKEPIYVTFEASRNSFMIPFVDLEQNERFEKEVPAWDAMKLYPTLVRKRPKAYVIPADYVSQVEKLRTLGIEVNQLQRPMKCKIEKFVVKEIVESKKKWEGIYPKTVRTTTFIEKEQIPAGSYYIPLAQKLGNLIVTLLEPESMNGFVNFGVIEVEQDKIIPVYRILN